MNRISFKLKFRPSVNPNKEGSLFIQMIYQRKVRRIKTDYLIFNNEWDDNANSVILPSSVSPRYTHLNYLKTNIEWELLRLKKAAAELEKSNMQCNVDEMFCMLFPTIPNGLSVFAFIHSLVQHKKKLGKIRSSETYQATLNSFMIFREGRDMSFEMIDSELMELYEAALRSRGLSRNTTSFYMRILRTVYKKAVEKGMTQDRHPFKHVYCGMDKTIKRNIPFKAIKQMKNLDLSKNKALDFARDMFLFSFYTRGMSFVDMAYLKKTDLRNGTLVYRRKKTGQLLSIEWTRQMQEIIDKYKSNATQYLLSIILREDGSERSQYLNQSMKINRRLKEIASLIKLNIPLSLYVARHSWATIARGKDIPISVISEGLGHDSEMTTQIYLDSIKSSEVDKANRKILSGL